MAPRREKVVTVQRLMAVIDKPEAASLAAGALSDRIGRRPVLLAWAGALALLAYPLMALMARGEVDHVLTGADRIAANGDAADKIGTYTLAVLAAHHGLPFTVVAPTSTIDPDTATGAGIPLEERAGDEVTTRFAARNPAFDVTPAALVAAIVTEAGVHRAPYDASLPRVVHA